MLLDFFRILGASWAGGLIWVTTFPDFGWHDVAGSVLLGIVFATRPKEPAALQTAQAGKGKP